MPNGLYNAMRFYITNQVLYEHRKIMHENVFLEQLTPSTRFSLLSDLFSGFEAQFGHFFLYE
jgi:hypothetical protein